MPEVSDSEIENRLREDSPWWQSGGAIEGGYAGMARRAYLLPLSRLIRAGTANRTILLIGPWRVGKTILVFHAIDVMR